MLRRDVPKALLASAAGTVLLAEPAAAQTCTPPCYAQTSSEIAAGVTPVDYAHAPGNVRRYGADPTGVTDSDMAIRNAMKAALTGNNMSGIGDHARIYFPRDTYRILSDGIFNNPTDFQRGFIIEGDGMASSVLKLETGGTNKYFYNNTNSGSQQYIFVTVRDLQLTSDSTTYGNGFKFQVDQGWKFFRVWARVLNNFIESRGGVGGVNGSEHKFVACKITDIYGAVHIFDNDQCLNIEYVACDVESIFGHIFKVEAGGGGALRVHGGSYIMDDSGSDKYLLTINGYGTGSNNNTFTFSGIQTELHDHHTCLVFKGNAATSALIVFNDCNLRAQGAARELVNIAAARVVFNRGYVPTSGMTYAIVTSGGGISYERHGDPGSLIFNEVEVTEDLASLITTGPFGYASARGCQRMEYQPAVETRLRYAMDFDLNWENRGRGGNFPGLKAVNVKINTASWPFTGDGSVNDWSVQLPEGVLITNIYVYRPAGSSARPIR